MPLKHDNKKQQRGGTRQGSGAKPKYGEKTTTVSFRVPISIAEDVKGAVKSMLSEKCL